MKDLLVFITLLAITIMPAIADYSEKASSDERDRSTYPENSGERESTVADLNKKLESVASFLRDSLNLKSGALPAQVIQEARGFLFLYTFKAGVIFQIQGGYGISFVRDTSGNWHGPAFYAVAGPGIGALVGGQSSKLVVLINDEAGLDLLKKDHIADLGVSVDATLVNRNAAASASTELHDKNNIYCYSRSKGLYLGAGLDGLSVSFSQADNAAYYGVKDQLSAQRVLFDSFQIPTGAAAQIAEVLSDPFDAVTSHSSNVKGKDEPKSDS